MSPYRNIMKAVMPVALMAGAVALLSPGQAHAWWRGGVVVGFPPVYVAPPPVYVPPPVVYAPPPPVYYAPPPYPRWIPPHYNKYGAFVPGHYA